MTNSNYTKQIINDYCVIDAETTGLSAYYDDIIEIGVLKVRDNVVIDQYSQLIQPRCSIDPFITELTGITNDMVSGMPSIADVKDSVLSFIGEDVLLGHNTSFDIRFLNEGFRQPLINNYMDTMQFARKVFPGLKHYRLSDLTEYLGLPNNEHRSIADCIATKELYDAIKATMSEKGLKIQDLWAKTRRNGKRGYDISSIVPSAFEIDEDSFFYGKHVVFTGKLERMIRRDAMQIVVNLGGILDNSVTKETNFLILGNNDYNVILKGEKSSKHKKAEKLKLEGQDIEILDEYTFYDILNDQ